MLELAIRVRQKFRKISEYWMGIGKLNRKTAEIYVYSDLPNPLKVKVDIRTMKMMSFEEVDRIPGYVSFLDSALEEYEKAERCVEDGDIIGAVKSLWGSVNYALTAYGIAKKKCRYVEHTLLEMAADVSGEALEKYVKLHIIMSDQFGLEPDEFTLAIFQNSARMILDAVLRLLLR